jgi:hypothetical protein
VRAVDVRVGEDDDLAVAEAAERARRGVALDPEAEADDERRDLGALVEARVVLALDVEDLAAEREDRLRAPVARLLRRAAGRVALDEEDLGRLAVGGGAVGELAGERRLGEDRL